MTNLPYFICAMSPTTISATGIWMTWPPRTTVNFCSCSMRLWRPLNCFSLLQSLNAVTNTTQITERRMAAPSIQPASDSVSSSTPPAALPQSAEMENIRFKSYHNHCHTCWSHCLQRETQWIIFFPSDRIIFQIILIYEAGNCQIVHQKCAESGLSGV